jgi:hypothetical protein
MREWPSSDTATWDQLAAAGPYPWAGLTM